MNLNDIEIFKLTTIISFSISTISVIGLIILKRNGRNFSYIEKIFFLFLILQPSLVILYYIKFLVP